MYYAGNFNAEKGKLKVIDEDVQHHLETIKETLSGMSEYWQDSKSGNFIANTEAMIDSFITKKSEVIENGQRMLDEVGKQFDIYN